ncbi:predicted protein [Sclerotinia sclerotiorum 1980 UF-70]|uniref:BZIP domain-containing protein n=2 Tax=Sclerotinia sclerotiorum (strain ATCC 18683 / 1980 / Ss-1) TaxID=665079 RepID=A7F5Y0_SCLS1|nr:predicted protein [Sclerotinia sclerotiorum 1980 UF-70]APA07409.1 hypothetical protein sscle_02g021790 [Sclerotinia sclerotiorum 1980 UF-70]EDN98151.1 predicted protein [Sclerotinia sclerotiorum 1980 UF-70]
MTDNSGTTTPVTAKMEGPQLPDNKPQATKSRRSVQNMNPVALQKKRENDRNAQRNIREKARNNLAEMQRKVKNLEGRLSLAEKVIQRSKALLLEHGIDPGQALSVEMVAFEEQNLDLPQGISTGGLLEGIEIDRPTVGFQSQQYAPVSQPMYPTIPANLHQPMVQPQPNGLGSMQYMGSPQHFESHTGSSSHVGSPLSLENSHHTMSHTGSPQISSSPQFPVPQGMGNIPRSMRAFEQLGQSHPMEFNQSMLPGPMGPISHMAGSHPMSQSQSMPLLQNSGFHNAFSSPSLIENPAYSSPNTMMWDNGADAAYRHNLSGYPAVTDHMTLV